MRLFRIYVDGNIFYHPNLSKLAITQAKVLEDAENIDKKVDEISALEMYRIEIYVDGVSIFRDRGQTSVMRCKVFSWEKDITDSISAAAFKWHRKSNNSTQDEEWDANHIGMKSITIHTEDVQDNASFYCEVTL